MTRALVLQSDLCVLHSGGENFTRNLFAAFAIILAATTIPLRGRTLVGFRYRVMANTEFTVCPDRVANQTGDVITLTSSEQFKVVGVETADLADKLATCGSFVKVDRQHKYLSIRKRTLVCGMRPEMNQWLTIPLIAADRAQTHYADAIADIEPIPTTEQK